MSSVSPAAPVFVNDHCVRFYCIFDVIHICRGSVPAGISSEWCHHIQYNHFPLVWAMEPNYTFIDTFWCDWLVFSRTRRFQLVELQLPRQMMTVYSVLYSKGSYLSAAPCHFWASRLLRSRWFKARHTLHVLPGSTIWDGFRSLHAADRVQDGPIQ